MTDATVDGGDSTVSDPPEPRRGRGCLVAAIGVGVGGVALVVAFLVGAHTGANRDAADLGGPPPAAKYRLGDTASTGGLRVTVFGVHDPQPSAHFPAPAGGHYVSVDVQLANPGHGQQLFAAVIGFHLLDATGNAYDVALVPELLPGTPDGAVPAGGSIRGLVAFAVPDAASGLRLRIQGSPTTAGVVFRLS